MHKLYLSLFYLGYCKGCLGGASMQLHVAQDLSTAVLLNGTRTQKGLKMVSFEL